METARFVKPVTNCPGSTDIDTEGLDVAIDRAGFTLAFTSALDSAAKLFSIWLLPKKPARRAVIVKVMRNSRVAVAKLVKLCPPPQTFVFHNCCGFLVYIRSVAILVTSFRFFVARHL